MEESLVSIITPVYNAERFITKTVESVIKQSYQQWELLLVNDCSTDDSLTIINQLATQDERIKVINLAQNSGAAVARNTGLDYASGKYIAFIDSDDCWGSEKLAKQIAFMQAGQIALSYTDFAFVDEEGELIKEKADIPLTLDYEGLLKNTAIACSTVMIDRDKVKPFHMPLLRKGQDTATWLLLMRENNIAAYGLKDVLNYYRQVKGSISHNKIGALKRTWNTYYNVENLPLSKASYYFTHYVLNAIMRRI